MKIYIDPAAIESKFNLAEFTSDKPIPKDGYVFLLKKPDGTEFSEEDILYGPALIVSDKL
jgi:hypothetical protein